eukprot:TRINITY_DN15828_c0_g1_i1.p1 TRINITY_DN15828_c0_g1~~TRINITY_DN15828_c0_g1_i1.p1  ORF type:complete len:261 (+),score=30.43 TRINITY_DN15828_c0_g1_i1:42-824(+)
MSNAETLNWIIIPILITLIALICLVVIVLGNMKRWFRWDEVLQTQENLGTSRFIPATLFLIFRLLAFLFIVATYVVFIFEERSLVLYLFGMWNYVLLGLFFLLATIFSLRHVITRHTFEPKTLTSFVAGSMWVLFQVGLVTGLLTGIGFWSAVYTTDEDISADFTTICLTAASIFLPLIEWILNKLPFVAIHSVFSILWGVCFSIYVLIQDSNDDMNKKNWDATAYFVLFFVAILVIHLLFVGLEHIKRALSPKREYLPT